MGAGSQGAAWVSERTRGLILAPRASSKAGGLLLPSSGWDPRARPPDNEKQDVLPAGCWRQGWASAWVGQLGDKLLREVPPKKHLLWTFQWIVNQMANSKWKREKRNGVSYRVRP